MVVPVYEGGDYWKECWKSICQNLDYFSSVVLSFNKGKSQDSDSAATESCHDSKIHRIKQPRLYTAVQHICKITECLERIDAQHVFFLAHDDILVREGLREFANKEIGDNDAVFGSHLYFSDKEPTRQLICREILSHKNGIAVADFVKNDIDKNYKFNLSGIIIPRLLALKLLPYQKLFAYGYRMDTFIVCNPFVERIHQTFAPTVMIREREGSEGKINKPVDRIRDTIAYFYAHIAFTSDRLLIKKCIHAVSAWMLSSKRHILFSVFHLVRTQLWFLTHRPRSFKSILFSLLCHFTWMAHVVMFKSIGLAKKYVHSAKDGPAAYSMNMPAIQKNAGKKRIVFSCFYPESENDFGRSHGKDNYGFSLLYPIVQLRKKLEGLGFDVYAKKDLPIDQADIVACVDLRPEHYKEVQALPDRIKKILLCVESPIYAPHSHDGKIISDKIWNAVLTWNRSFSASNIHHYDIGFAGKQLISDSSYLKERKTTTKGVIVSSYKRDIRGNTDIRDRLYLELAALGKVDLFGRGWPSKKAGVLGPTSNKIKTMSHYRYAVICENSLWPGYVTEKLADSILAGLPSIYYGDIDTAQQRFPGAFVALDDLSKSAFVSAMNKLDAEYDTLVQCVLASRESSDLWCHSFLEKFCTALTAL